MNSSKIAVWADYQELSKKAAQFVFDQLIQAPPARFVLGLATGSTQVGFREELIRLVRQARPELGNLYLVNLDEYWPIKNTNRQSYYREMKTNFWRPLLKLDLGFKLANAFIPNGEAHNPAAEAQRYEDRIRNLGGVDLQVLGIGVDGHIGFNERGSLLASRTRLVELSNSTIEANKRFFGNDNSLVPKQAITMGIATILEAKKILLLATGRKKRAVINQFLRSKPTSQLPASFLKLHPDVTIMVDQEAYSTPTTSSAQ